MVLRALIDEKDNPDLRDGAKRILRSTNGKPVDVCHVAIGEAFSTIAESDERNTDDCCDAMREFRLMLRSSSLRLCGLHDGKGTHELALRLHKEDPQLESNDGLIIANALLCKECSVFYTNDKVPLYSTTIQEIAQEFKTKIIDVPVRDTNARRRKRF